MTSNSTLSIQILFFFSIFRFFQDALTVKKGEEITGSFEMAPNKNNERDLDINISFDFKGEVCDLNEQNTYTMH